jgi:hypothetical protein
MAAQSPDNAVILMQYLPLEIFAVSSIGIHLPLSAIHASPVPVLYLMDDHAVGDIATITISNSFVGVAALARGADSINTDAQVAAKSIVCFISCLIPFFAPNAAQQGRELASVPCCAGWRILSCLRVRAWRRGRTWPAPAQSSTALVAVRVNRLSASRWTIAATRTNYEISCFRFSLLSRTLFGDR